MLAGGNLFEDVLALWTVIWLATKKRSIKNNEKIILTQINCITYPFASQSFHRLLQELGHIIFQEFPLIAHIYITYHSDTLDSLSLVRFNLTIRLQLLCYHHFIEKNEVVSPVNNICVWRERFTAFNATDYSRSGPFNGLNTYPIWEFGMSLSIT